MSGIVLGILFGVLLGLIAIAPMSKMTFTDRRAVILGAFINRFAIGFLIPNALLFVNPILRGLLLGILLSLPDAIITKAYRPIMGLGAIGGLVIGVVLKLLFNL
jgi:hypothetical protein